MRIAISNIAWDPSEDAQVARLLNALGIDAIDIAPTKYFPDLVQATDQAIAQVRQWWLHHGIAPTGMQSLLFGTAGLNLFGDTASQQAMLTHLAAVCRVGQGLGATRLVFGSPRNRDRSGLSDEQALAQAVHFFRQLGSIAQDYGVIICLEPNPACYGANFMTHSLETCTVVKAVDHPAIRMQFDTGALAINEESPDDILALCAPWVGHVHLSEPNLVPLGDGGTDHAAMCRALRQYMPGVVVSVEMLATANEPHLQSVARALTYALQVYRKGAVSEGTL